MISNILHQKEGDKYIPSKEYYTVHDISSDILKKLRSNAIRKNVPTDVLSDFILDVTEGTFPLFKKKGISMERIIFQRFKNYCFDYFDRKKMITVELTNDIVDTEQSELDAVNIIFKIYEVCKTNKERLLLLCELFKAHQRKHSTNKVHCTNIIADNIIPLQDIERFKMIEHFGKNLTNYSECYIMLDNPTASKYNEMKQNLYKKLNELEPTLF